MVLPLCVVFSKYIPDIWYVLLLLFSVVAVISTKVAIYPKYIFFKSSAKTITFDATILEYDDWTTTRNILTQLASWVTSKGTCWDALCKSLWYFLCLEIEIQSIYFNDILYVRVLDMTRLTRHDSPINLWSWQGNVDYGKSALG